MLKLPLRAPLALPLYLLCAWAPAWAQHEHGSNVFEVFYAAEAMLGSGQSHPAEDDDTYANADILFAAATHQFRALGELFVSPKEHDLERLQSDTSSYRIRCSGWAASTCRPAPGTANTTTGGTCKPPSLGLSSNDGKTSMR